MAATANLDTVTTLEIQEEYGVVTALTREVLVSNLTYTDSRALTEACGASGVPVYGDTPTGYSGLRLVKRAARIVPGDPKKAVVTLNYTQYGNTGIDFIFSGSSTLSQINTPNDYYGNQILVQHTWPADDRDWPSQTQVQGGTVSVLVPQTTLTATGVINGDYPLWTKILWLGSINAYYWASAPAGQWICSRCDFIPFNLTSTPHQWKFTFEFQHNLQGWNQYAVFIDPRTGQPPANVVLGVGVVPVTWYPSLNFAAVFPGT